VLVFDETDTTFRTAAGGLGALHGVAADLVCLSSAVAAGMPLAAVVGRRALLGHLSELTDEERREPDLLSVEVAKAVLREHRRQPFLAHLARLAGQLREGINRSAADPAAGPLAGGYPGLPRLLLSSDPRRHRALFTRFTDEMAAHGVLVGGDVLYLTAAHTSEQIRFVVAAATASLQAIGASTDGPGG
jgi:aminotransferase MxcL